MSWRQAGGRAVLITVGLAVGLGGFGLFRSFRSGAGSPEARPSVARFTFTEPSGLTTAPSWVTAGGADPAQPGAEPPDAAAALAAFRQAAVDGRPQDAWLLLDSPGRERYPTAAAWTAAQADRPAPTGFEITGATPANRTPEAGDLDVSVVARYQPSLDEFRGLVPARADEVWLVRNEGGRWRVGADPVDARPVLPSAEAAPAAVRAWLARAAACDARGASELQVDARLLGPADLARLPCERRDSSRWDVGAPLTLDRSDDFRALLAAYGPGAASWARLVPVRGGDRSFVVQVAPFGDAWRVVGVAADG